MYLQNVPTMNVRSSCKSSLATREVIDDNDNDAMIAFISLMVQKVLYAKLLDESNWRYLNFKARTIQKYWRGVVSNPHHVCANLMTLYNFERTNQSFSDLIMDNNSH